MRNIFWASTVIGFWLLISPWALDVSAINTVVVNNVSIGIVLIFSSLWILFDKN